MRYSRFEACRPSSRRVDWVGFINHRSDWLIYMVLWEVAVLMLVVAVVRRGR